MTTDTKRKPERSRGFRILIMCIGVLLSLMVLFIVGGNLLWEINSRMSAVVLRRSDCMDYLHRLSHDLSVYGVAHPEAISPDKTVADVIRAALLDGELDGKNLCCARDGRSYLVFPAPASVLRLEPEPERVPIVMDRPDAHQEGAFVTTAYRVFRDNDPANVRVLYSDGTLDVISREAAEKLVSAHSPQPIEMAPEAQNEEKP